MITDIESFWKAHLEFMDEDMKPSDSFKRLFESMVNSDFEKRPTIEEIKKNEWYNGPTYNSIWKYW